MVEWLFGVTLQTRRPTMLQFVTCVKYSDDGFNNMYDTDADEWLTDAREVIHAHGGELKDHYLTMGEYDAIVVVEFPTKEAALKARLTVAQASGVEEARPHLAFSEAESRAIIDELGG
jgi:uncharacterized protein with GYD domain